MHRLLTIFVAAFLCSACVRSITTVDLRPDGSGTIQQETSMSQQTLAMIKGFAPADQKGGPPADIFSEEQAKKMAATMGVTFVSGEPIKTADQEGYRARYSFDDITKVKVNMEPGPDMPSGKTKEDVAFTFDRRPTSSVLTIQMPQQKPGSKGPLGPLGSPPGADPDNPQMAAQAMTMMKTMMKGLFVDITLNVNGRIIKTNAPYVDGSSVTLLQVDFDKLLVDDAALQKLKNATDPKSLANLPGMKIVIDPKVTIEFAR
jgi:hypothetical protein